MSSWRNEIDEGIRSHLELQIKEASKYRKSYLKARDVSKAQLWCAVANLSKQIHQLNTKLTQIEKELYSEKQPPKKVKYKKAADLIESINQL